MSDTPLICLRGMTKRYGNLVANDGVDLDIGRGEVLALLGENGAGKSTLMKLLYGVVSRDAGTVEIDGEAVAIASPRDAMARGIGMVFQQFSLVPAFTVLENLLAAWPHRMAWRSAAEDRAVMERLHRLAPEIATGKRVRDLAVGERQLVELAKVLNLDARLVILDEPTSVLTPQEAGRLHGFVRSLRDEGRSIVLITHKLTDVHACADRVAIMRGGKLVDVARVDARDDGELIEAMIGRRVELPARQTTGTFGPPRLVLKNLTCHGTPPARDIDIEIRRGEIVGIAGVAGNGQWALAETVAGLIPPLDGDVLLDGEPAMRVGERDAFLSPVAYIPEEPMRNAVVGGLSLADNLALRDIAGNTARPDAAAVTEQLRAFDVRPPEPRRAAGTLSGGNLQKLVAARELSRDPAAIIACYPTMGLDVQASAAILDRLVAHARNGAAVLWIGEEIDDLIRLADRIAVIHAGRIDAMFDGGAASAVEIGRHMAGHASEAA